MKSGLKSIKSKMILTVFMLFMTTAFTGHQLYKTELMVRDALKEREIIHAKDEQLSEAIFRLDQISLQFNRHLMGEISQDTLASNIKASAQIIERISPDISIEIPLIIRDIQKIDTLLRSNDPDAVKSSHHLLMAVNTRIHEIDRKLDWEIDQLKQNVKQEIQSPESSLYLLTVCLSLILAIITLAISDIFLPLAKINRILLNIGQGKSYHTELEQMTSAKGEIGQAHKALSDLIYKLADTVQGLEAMNENHQKKISALEASKGGIGITDANGNLIFGNQALFEIHGIPHDEASSYIGRPSMELYAQEHRQLLLNKILPSVKQNGFWQGEVFFSGLDGKARYGDFSLTRLSDNSFIGTVIDVSARKEAEKEKENAEALFMQAQKMEAIGRLTGGIAHDFNNMLTIVQGNLELLQKTAIQHAPKAQMFAETALRAIHRSSELTSHLLSFSRKQFLQPKNLVLNQFLPESSILVSRLLGEKIDLIMNLSSNRAAIHVDPGQLETAILNLAINAKDAMADGGEIILSTEILECPYGRNLGQTTIPQGEYVRITVQDTGHGMDSETLSQIFEPFFTTKETGKGTGLGLSMVYGFVKQSKGYIDVESALGEGTSIHLYFPLAQNQEEEKNIQIPQSEHIEPLRRQGKILIAEDEDDLRELNKNLLLDLGYSVLCADNGDKALEILRDNDDIDMLLSDVVMSGISGKDLAIEARKMNYNIKILLTSGYTNEMDVSEIDKDGLRFIPKPYSQAKLTNEIDSIMQGKVHRGGTI